MTSVRGHSSVGCFHLVPVHNSFTAVSSRLATVALCVLAIGLAVLESLLLILTHIARVFTKLFLVLCRRCFVSGLHVLPQVDTILLHLGDIASHSLLILPCFLLVLMRIGWSRLSEGNQRRHQKQDCTQNRWSHHDPPLK